MLPAASRADSDVFGSGRLQPLGFTEGSSVHSCLHHPERQVVVYKVFMRLSRGYRDYDVKISGNPTEGSIPPVSQS